MLDVLFNELYNYLPGGASGVLRRYFHDPEPLIITKAKGTRIWSTNKEFIDYHMAFGAIILGHNDDDVVKAVKEQAERLILHGAGVADVEVEVAKLLTKLIPSAEKVVFTPSGTEAVMLAMRLARAYTGRSRILKFEGHYHGWHDYSLYNVSTPVSKGKRAETLGIPKQVQETVEVARFNDVEHLEMIKDSVGDDIAAVIMEPVAHSMGVIPPTREFLDALKKFSKDTGALIIFDEIITALRHNLRGMQSEYGIDVHMTTVGKSIGNGMPIAALLGKSEIMDMLTQGVVSSGTYQAHPLSLAAAKATIDKLVKRRADGYLAKIGDEHCKVMRELVEELGIKAYVSCFRSIFTIYFGLDKQPLNLDDLRNVDRKAYKRFAVEMRKKGILVNPNPAKRMHLTLAHGNEELEKFAERARESLKVVKREVVSVRA